MKLHWVNDQDALESVALGYTRANRSLQQACPGAGIELTPDADTALYFGWPWEEAFKPFPGKRTVLMSMYECDELHPTLLAAFPKADLILTPSDYCARLFQAATTTPVRTVPLGIDPARFPFVARTRPEGRPFRWLWLGANDRRKGHQEVIAAWDRAFIRRTDCELYLKTVRDDHRVLQTLNVIEDSRLLEDGDMRALYASADGFVFPSWGEGFGLTLLEAMATGLPCLTIRETGVTEFATPDTVIALKAAKHPETTAREGWTEHVWHADVPALANTMDWTMRHWREARRIGRRAAKRAQQFTWAHSARRLREVLTAEAGRQAA